MIVELLVDGRRDDPDAGVRARERCDPLGGGDDADEDRRSSATLFEQP